MPFTLLMAKTKAMVLVFGFSFPVSACFQGKSGFSFGKVGLVFGFKFGLREGVGVFLPLLSTVATQIKLKLIPPKYFVTFAFVLILPNCHR